METTAPVGIDLITGAKSAGNAGSITGRGFDRLVSAQIFNGGRPAVNYLTLPFLANFTDLAILLLRLMVGLIFFTSGWAHATKSEERSKSIEKSKGFTIFLGFVECAGALGVVFGVLTQWAAIGLILVMLGAMQKKIVKWKISFWGRGTDGWSYEVMMMLMNFVIATTAGGRYTLEKLFH